MNAKNGHVTNYWLKFYCANHCTLCGNWGWLDTRRLQTPAGYVCGRMNWCICPNGQLFRQKIGGMGPTDDFIKRSRS